MFQFTSEKFRVNVGLAQMLKGGVIMDVTNAEQARIAEDAGAGGGVGAGRGAARISKKGGEAAGACAVVALERVPADIRKQGGVARMSDPQIILDIMEAVTIPVMAKARIGHFVEAQVLKALG